MTWNYNRKETRIRDLVFPSRKAAGDYFGIDSRAIQWHADRGTLDNVGLPPDRERTRNLISAALGYPCRVGKRDFPSVASAARFYKGGAGRLLSNLHAGYKTWKGYPIEWLPEALSMLGNAPTSGYAVRVGDREFASFSAANRFFGIRPEGGGLSRAINRGNRTWRGMEIELLRPGPSVKKLPHNAKTIFIGPKEFPSVASGARAHKAGRAATRRLSEIVAKGGGRDWLGLEVLVPKSAEAAEMIRDGFRGVSAAQAGAG